jgi:hypothetical protein
VEQGTQAVVVASSERNRHASPMAYQFDGQQYIAIASGDDILVFGLLG